MAGLPVHDQQMAHWGFRMAGDPLKVFEEHVPCDQPYEALSTACVGPLLDDKLQARWRREHRLGMAWKLVRGFGRGQLACACMAAVGSVEVLKP